MAVKLNAFVGFPDAKLKPISIPDLFFVDLLPQIDDLAELKLTLHCFWLLNNQEGDVRYLRGEDLRNDPALLQSLGSETDLRAPRNLLEDALGRAVARNTLLKLEVEVEKEDEEEEQSAIRNPPSAISKSQFTWQDWYFMNTAKGRQTIQLIREGKLPELLVSIPDEARLRVKRPTVFVIYEQNIGLLTPLIADQLRDMEKSYPPDWVSEAFETAVRNNKRNLRYVQNILKRWETEGKGNRESAIPTTEEQRRRQYIPDEFSDIILR